MKKKPTNRKNERNQFTFETCVAQRLQKSAFGLQQGWADFFVRRQIWKLFFIAGHIIQTSKLWQSYNFCKAEKIGLFVLLLTVFDQISGIEKSMLLFLLPEKGPRAAKRSWRAACGQRAALWPCLEKMTTYDREYFSLSPNAKWSSKRFTDLDPIL